MLKKLFACGLLGPLLLATAAGCSGRQGEVEMPKGEIPLPKDGPKAAGVPSGKGAKTPSIPAASEN